MTKPTKNIVEFEMILNEISRLTGDTEQQVSLALGKNVGYLAQIRSRAKNDGHVSQSVINSLKLHFRNLMDDKNEAAAPNENPYIKHRHNLKNTQKDNDLMYYEIGASAGTAHSAEILPVKKNEGVLHINDLFRGSQYAIRISGNSMTPNYPSGAIIGIREIPDKQITPGSVYIIEKDNDLWIKRMFYKNDDQSSGIFECVSDNTMKYESGTGREGRLYYPPFYINIDEVRKLFKVTGIYKPNELTVIN